MGGSSAVLTKNFNAKSPQAKMLMALSRLFENFCY
jgi:hypothetical protein